MSSLFRRKLATIRPPRHFIRAPVTRFQRRQCIIEPGMHNIAGAQWEYSKTQAMYVAGMCGLLLCAYFNSYGESRGVWAEDDPMYQEVLRVLHHPKFLSEVGFPLETGLASEIQTPRGYSNSLAPFRYLMVYGSRMRGQVKVEFEDLFRGWIAIHVNLDNGKRYSFYNPQKFELPSEESPAFQYTENAELDDVLVEKGQHVPMPDKIPREAWHRFYQLAKGMGVFICVALVFGYLEAFRHGKARIKRHLNNELTKNGELENILGFPLRVDRKDFGQFKLDGNKFFLASRIHGSLGTGQFCCYGEHNGDAWEFRDSFVQVDEDIHSATRVNIDIDNYRCPPPVRKNRKVLFNDMGEHENIKSS